MCVLCTGHTFTISSFSLNYGTGSNCVVLMWCEGSCCCDKRLPASGYQYLHFTTPSVHAPTHGDVSVFFDTEHCFKNYSAAELLRAAWPQLRFLLMSLGCVLIPATPLLGVIFYKQKFEPVEQTMDPEEFWKNFKFVFVHGAVCMCCHFERQVVVKSPLRWLVSQVELLRGRVGSPRIRTVFGSQTCEEVARSRYRH